MRRLIHVALVVVIMLGVRACGGAARTEDRLGAATRWTAEKVGLAGTKDSFDAKVRPPMAAATRSLSDAIYGGASRTMDSVELAAGGFTGWVMQHVRSALGLVDSSLAPVVAPRTDERERPDPNDEKEGRAAPQR